MLNKKIAILWHQKKKKKKEAKQFRHNNSHKATKEIYKIIYQMKKRSITLVNLFSLFLQCQPHKRAMPRVLLVLLLLCPRLQPISSSFLPCHLCFFLFLCKKHIYITLYKGVCVALLCPLSPFFVLFSGPDSFLFLFCILFLIFLHACHEDHYAL